MPQKGQIARHEWEKSGNNVGLYTCKHCSWKLVMTISNDLFIHRELPSTRKEPACITRTPGKEAGKA